MIEEPSDENWIPPKSRHDEEVERSYHAALSASKIWIESVTEKSFKYPEDVRRSLEDGVILCELLNCLKQNCVRRINRHHIPMARLDNLNTFFSTCRREFSIRDGYLFDIHDLDDLTQRAYDEHELEFEARKRLLRVAVCLFWIGKASESFYSGPLLDYSAFSSIINDRDRRFAVTKNKGARLTARPSDERSPTIEPTSPIILRPKPAPLINNTKRPPDEVKSSTFSVIDPTYLTKQAKQQMKMLNDSMSTKRSYESDDEEADLWRQSLSDWREKRRRASASQNLISQDLSAFDRGALQREFNRSHSVQVFPSFITRNERHDTNGFCTSPDEDPVFEAVKENDMLNSKSFDVDEMKDVNQNHEENVRQSIDDVDFACILNRSCNATLQQPSSNHTSAPTKRMIKQHSIHEMRIMENHTASTSQPPKIPAFEHSSYETSQVDASNVTAISEQEILKINKDEKRLDLVNDKMSKLDLDQSSSYVCNDRMLLSNKSNLSPLKVSFVEDLLSELQDDPPTPFADDSSVQSSDIKFTEHKTSTPPPTERKSTKKYRAPPPPSSLQHNVVERQILSPPQPALRPPRSPNWTSTFFDVGNGQEPAVPPRRRRSHVSSDGDYETSAIIKSSLADSPSGISDSVTKNRMAAEENVSHEEYLTPIDAKNEESSSENVSSKVTSETTPQHTYPPHVSEKINENFSASHYSDENLVSGESRKIRTLTSNETLPKIPNAGHGLPINDSHYNQLNRYSSQQTFECSVCSKTLCQEVVAIALKELGLQFHVTCFYCWNCKRPLGGRCSSGGLFVSDDRLFCLRCHSCKMGMTVQKLGRF